MNKNISIKPFKNNVGAFIDLDLNTANKDQINKMADLGLLGMMVEPEWNGNGMDTVHTTPAPRINQHPTSKGCPGKGKGLHIKGTLQIDLGLCLLSFSFGFSYLSI